MLPEPCDDYWSTVTVGHQQDLLGHFAETVQTSFGERAANFFEGEGLNGGVGLFAPKALLNRYQKQGRYAMACFQPLVLETFGQLHDNTNKTCPRCAQAPETLTHRHWQCAANSLIFEPEVVDTQSLSECAISH